LSKPKTAPSGTAQNIFMSWIWSGR
jgi:hypothetical protein